MPYRWQSLKTLHQPIALWQCQHVSKCPRHTCEDGTRQSASDKMAWNHHFSFSSEPEMRLEASVLQTEASTWPNRPHHLWKQSGQYVFNFMRKFCIFPLVFWVIQKQMAELLRTVFKSSKNLFFFFFIFSQTSVHWLYLLGKEWIKL